MLITKKINAILLGMGLLLAANSALAVCPICTFAVGAGIGLAQWLGIDDVITGIWIGAFIVSLSMWTINWLNSKNIHFKGRKVVVTLSYYVLTIFPLCRSGVIGHMLNKLWGIDKLVLGIIIGSIVFFAFSLWYGFLKKRNDGRAYFPFQKVVMPLAPLLILSCFFYFYTK